MRGIAHEEAGYYDHRHLRVDAGNGGMRAETGTPDPVRPVLTTVVEPTLPVSTVTAGSVEPRYTTNIGFRVLGRLISRPVNVGDLVEEGRNTPPQSIPRRLNSQFNQREQSFHETRLDLRMQPQRKNENGH